MPAAQINACTILHAFTIDEKANSFDFEKKGYIREHGETEARYVREVKRSRSPRVGNKRYMKGKRVEVIIVALTKLAWNGKYAESRYGCILTEGERFGFHTSSVFSWCASACRSP